MANAAGIFKAVAPWLFAGASTLLPGPLGQAAAKIGAIVGNPTLKPDVQAISAAVAGATPDQLAQIRAADQQHELEMQKAGFEHVEDLLNAAFADTANARAREIQTKDSWTPRIIAAFVIVAWCVIEGFILWHAFSRAPELNPANSQLVGAISRMADAAFMLVIGYYFGSSIGSQNKDATIQNLSK
jgi:hypothetical protein